MNILMYVCKLSLIPLNLLIYLLHIWPFLIVMVGIVWHANFLALMLSTFGCRFQRYPWVSIFRSGKFSPDSEYWKKNWDDDDNDGLSSGRNIINDCDCDYYYSD